MMRGFWSRVTRGLGEPGEPVIDAIGINDPVRYTTVNDEVRGGGTP